MLSGLNAGNQEKNGPEEHGHRKASMLSGLNAGNQGSRSASRACSPSGFNAVRLERRKSGIHA